MAQEKIRQILECPFLVRQSSQIGIRCSLLMAIFPGKRCGEESKCEILFSLTCPGEERTKKEKVEKRKGMT